MSHPSALALLAALLLASPCAARADEPRARVEGERFGAVFPEATASPVRVLGGTIDFTVAPGLASAAVRAVYRLHNPGPAPEAGDVAFALVRGEHEDDPADRVALDVDGAPVEPRAVRAADRLAPLLVAWFEAHPEVSKQLATPAAHADPAALRRLVEAAGGRCEACSGLVAWQKNSAADEDDRLSKDLADDVLVSAAREVVPAEVDAVERRLGVAGRGPMAERIGYLLIPVEIQPGQTRTITARYQQLSSVDRTVHANATHAFDVLLSPARRWAGFGPLDVSVHVPERTRFRSPAPFVREGDVYRAELPGLPVDDLRFEAMALDGLWFGMIGRTGYWALLVAAMTLGAVLAGAAAGRVWAPGVRWRKVLVPLATAGPIAAVCNLGLFVVLFGAFPAGALGFGTAGLGRGLLLVAVSVPVGALASAAGAALARRGRGAPPANEVADHGR